MLNKPTEYLKALVTDLTVILLCLLVVSTHVFLDLKKFRGVVVAEDAAEDALFRVRPHMNDVFSGFLVVDAALFAAVTVVVGFYMFFEGTFVLQFSSTYLAWVRLVSKYASAESFSLVVSLVVSLHFFETSFQVVFTNWTVEFFVIVV